MGETLSRTIQCSSGNIHYFVVRLICLETFTTSEAMPVNLFVIILSNRRRSQTKDQQDDFLRRHNYWQTFIFASSHDANRSTSQRIFILEGSDITTRRKELQLLTHLHCPFQESATHVASSTRIKFSIFRNRSG
jgi:hypothetical protein